jgi:hypothetical protein
MPNSIDDIPLQTEDGLNLDHPDVVLFRRLMLERNAKVQNSDLYHAKCDTHLPYNHMTVASVPDGVDANFNPVQKQMYFCPICQEYFDANR